MGLENILKSLGRFNRKLITSSVLASSLLTSCGGSSDENTNEPTTPTNPTTQSVPPTITSTCPTQINEKSYYECQVQARSNSGNPLSYSLIRSSPTWLSVDHNFVFGTSPEVTQNTSFPITIKVSDGISSVEQPYTLTINNVNTKTTYVLTESNMNSLSQVSPSNLVFSQPVNFNAGDIVGAGITSKTPEGFLREITSISSDKKIVYTTQASLEQAIENANVSFNKTLTSSDIQSSSLVQGASLVAPNTSSLNGYDFSVNLTNVVLYDRDGNPNTTTDRVVANGSVSFNTNFSLDVKINNSSINYMKFKHTMSDNVDISVGSNVVGLATSNEIKVVEYKLQPFVLGVLPTPIPLPIVVVPKIGLYATINPTQMNPLSVRVTQNASLESYLKYENGWSSGADFSNNFTFSVPNPTGQGDMKVSFGPRIDLFLYGIAGPVGMVNGYLRLNYQNQTYSLFGGIEGNIGVAAEMFSKRLSANVVKVIDNEKLIAQGGSSVPTGDTFTDARDGKVYKTTKIGNQTWMAENLNFAHSNSRTYLNSSSNETIYGRLYGKVGAGESCPGGWKLPLSTDWDILFNSLGGKDAFGTGGKMKSTGTIQAGNGLWYTPNTGATNESGFKAIPGGTAEMNVTTSYSDLGYHSYFWVSTPTGALANVLSYNSSSANNSTAYGSNAQNVPLFSVRCVKN